MSTPTRRQFLQVGACVSLAGGMMPQGVAVADSEPAKPLEIIDCHTHFYDPMRAQGVPWPPRNSQLYRTVLPADLKKLPQFRPVTGTVVVEASPWLEDNQWLLDLAADDPFIVGIVGNLQPGEGDFKSHVKRFAANRLYRGIRINSKRLEMLLDQNRLDDLRRLADHNLSLDVNGGPTTPGIIARAAPQLPDLRIVLNHIGNVAITEKAPPEQWVSAIRAAAAQPNVSTKISALVEGAARGGNTVSDKLEFYRPYLDVVWHSFGNDRVIFGSNWPVSERAADYVTLQRLVWEYAGQQGAGVREKFFADNSKRIYQWLDR